MSLAASGSTNPGRLDRRVTLQSATTARNTVGDAVATWTNLATVWASKLPTSGGRMFAADAKHYEAALKYRIRHRTDTDAGMRLVHGDDTYEITAVSEQGRKHYLDLELRAIDQTTGHAVNATTAGDTFVSSDGSEFVSSGGDTFTPATP